MCDIEVTVGIEITQRESHGNGNKTPTWEWQGVRINADGNWNDSYSHGGEFPRILMLWTFTVTDITFRMMTVEILCLIFNVLRMVFLEFSLFDD